MAFRMARLWLLRLPVNQSFLCPSPDPIFENNRREARAFASAATPCFPGCSIKDAPPSPERRANTNSPARWTSGSWNSWGSRGPRSKNSWPREKVTAMSSRGFKQTRNTRAPNPKSLPGPPDRNPVFPARRIRANSSPSSTRNTDRNAKIFFRGSTCWTWTTTSRLAAKPELFRPSV